MKLIYDTIKAGSPGTSGFDDCLRFFPPSMFSGRWSSDLIVIWMNLILPGPILEIFWSSLRSGSWTGGDGAWVELSGKMHVLARLLAQLRQKTDDRIVLVSNYTQVLSFNLKWLVLQLKWISGDMSILVQFHIFPFLLKKKAVTFLQTLFCIVGQRNIST